MQSMRIMKRMQTFGFNLFHKENNLRRAPGYLHSSLVRGKTRNNRRQPCKLQYTRQQKRHIMFSNMMEEVAYQ